jgi:hypothetical protein
MVSRCSRFYKSAKTLSDQMPLSTLKTYVYKFHKSVKQKAYIDSYISWNKKLYKTQSDCCTHYHIDFAISEILHATSPPLFNLHLILYMHIGFIFITILIFHLPRNVYVVHWVHHQPLKCSMCYLRPMKICLKFISMCGCKGRGCMKWRWCSIL